MSDTQILKLRAGEYFFPVKVIEYGEQLRLSFGYNKSLLGEIKSMTGARWHPTDCSCRICSVHGGKAWTITNNHRNKFQLKFLAAKSNEDSPYYRYDLPLDYGGEPKPIFNKALQKEVIPYAHQHEMQAHIFTRKQSIVCGEMGVGKTLADFIATRRIIETYGWNGWWYVAPKSVIRAIERELYIWGFPVEFRPKLMTYESLVKTMEEWKAGQRAPRKVTFDESARLKTPTSQRSQAARALADGVRQDWADDGFIVLMSGTPAPKSPADWWHQCLTKDTWITTSEGPRQIRELIGVPFNARVDGGDYFSPTGFFSQGKRLVYKLQTKDGYSLKCTSDHKICVDYNGLRIWKELSKIIPGEKVVISDSGNLHWNGYCTFDEGYLLGLLIGDGCVTMKEGLPYANLKFFPDDHCILGKAIASLNCQDYSITHCEGDSFILTSPTLNQICREFNLDNHKEITQEIQQGSSDFIRGLISGLFDTDGHAEKSRLRVSFAQTDYNRIETVQRLLSCLGIFSKIYGKNAQKSKIKGREIKSQNSYVLLITNQDAQKFYDRIGFQNPRKSKVLFDRCKNKHEWHTESCTEVISIIPLQEEEVYDATVNHIHAFAANGILVHNCEVACPGFLKEGDIFKFRNRLGIIKQVQSITGGIFPQLVTWKDDSKKCDICGKLKADHSDEAWLSGTNTDAQHVFKESKNEILGLYERLKGLVIIKWKKDCLDLPEKRYREIEVKPSGSILRLAGVLAKSSKTTIEGLTKLRELSDGFQYIEKEVGTKQCEHCLGTFEVIEKFEIPGTCPNCSKERNEYGQCMNHAPKYEDKVVKCPTCGGSGEVKRFERDVKRVDCPKDDALVDLLDEYSDVGRVVIYGGFTGTIDRIVDLCHNQDWFVIRVDQGKWTTTNPKNEMVTIDPLELFQNKTPEHLEKYPRVAFVAHAKSGGEGLTLTASPTIIYYSNDFDGNSRTQSEDRIHRPGMDVNRGATIVDIFHLPSDKKVYDNLKSKRKLELMSLGELTEVFGTINQDEERKT